MSVKSEVLSILKVQGKSTKNHVRFQIPADLREVFVEFKSGANKERYKNLVCTIRDSVIDDETLLKLLQDAHNCISLLDYDLRLFVQALMILGWNYRSELVVSRYQSFLEALVSAHIHYTDFVIEQLVKLFAKADSADWLDSVPNSTQAAHLDNVHLILKAILVAVPSSESIVIRKLQKCVPYFMISLPTYLTYLYSCMQVIDYLEHHRRDILLLVIDKLIMLDVHTSKEDAMVSGEEESMVDALDSGMLILFEYIGSVSRAGGGEVCLLKTKKLFDDLMTIMEESIFRTHGSFHVQFVVLYICSIHQSLTQAFLKTLWQKVENPGEATILRKTAVCYIASFLARAEFISNGFLKMYLHQMTCWVHRYIVNHDNSATKSTQADAHTVFFYVCQAVFYLIAFRQNDLFDSAKKLVFLQSLNLAKIVQCSLNPLAACDPGVVENFAAVAKDYQLAYCYSVIERNDRIFIQRPTIEPYFPFDPYLLKRSSRYITPLYREYHRETYNADDDVDVEQRWVSRSLEDDDFIPEKSNAIPIAVTYSTSPGFKMSI